MAIKVADEYVNTNPADSQYPGGSFKNASSPTATDGTPFEEKWPNDLQGFLQALLVAAGITPSGVPDTAIASQYMQALKSIVGLSSDAIRTVATTGPVLATDRVIVIDATAGAVNLTYLSAASGDARALYVQRKPTDPGTYAVTLLPASGVETLASEASIPLLPGEGYQYIPDGSTNYLQF